MSAAKDFYTGGVTTVAIQTSARTMLEIIAASGKPLVLKGVGVSFNAAAAAAGIFCELCYITATGTGTALTCRAADQSAAPSISATAKYNDTVEPTVSFVWIPFYVPPSSFDRFYFPIDDEIVAPVGAGFGLRVTGAASNTPNCAPYFFCNEA